MDLTEDQEVSQPANGPEHRAFLPLSTASDSYWLLNVPLSYPSELLAKDSIWPTRALSRQRVQQLASDFARHAGWLDDPDRPVGIDADKLFLFAVVSLKRQDPKRLLPLLSAILASHGDQLFRKLYAWPCADEPHSTGNDILSDPNVILAPWLLYSNQKTEQLSHLFKLTPDEISHWWSRLYFYGEQAHFDGYLRAQGENHGRSYWYMLLLLLALRRHMLRDMENMVMHVIRSAYERYVPDKSPDDPTAVISDASFRWPNDRCLQIFCQIVMSRLRCFTHYQTPEARQSPAAKELYRVATEEISRHCAATGCKALGIDQTQFCGGCSVAVYCSKEHQIEHRAEHKLYCWPITAGKT